MHRFAARRLAWNLGLAAMFVPVSLPAQDSARTTSSPLLTAPLPGNGSLFLAPPVAYEVMPRNLDLRL